jgi:hypothetical protein
MVEQQDQISRFGFVVGAPRSGTTSLSRHLRAHPDVCFSSTKEPHYFARFDLSGRGQAELEAEVQREYLDRYFGHCTDRSKLRVEGSVTYLYAAEQMEPVLRLWPDARFIICVRDPLAMVPSLHQRLLYLGDETVRSFEQAWALRHRRLQGEKIPRTCVEPRWLQYEEGGRLGAQVERFFEVVGRDRCHVVVFDDLSRDFAAEYRQVLEFLGLPDAGQRDFAAARSGKDFRFGWLQRLLKRPPVITRRMLAGKAFAEHLKETGGSKKPHAGKGQPSRILAARKKLLQWNSVPPKRVQLSPAIVAEFQELYAEDVERLGGLIGRDFSHWLGRGGRR